MVSIRTNKGDTFLTIVGHGLRVDSPFELGPGIVVEQAIPDFDLQQAAKGSNSFADYSAVVMGQDLASFVLRVEDTDPKALAIKGWNALWEFHLLSLAVQSPVYSLFSLTSGASPTFAAAHRSHQLNPSPNIATITQAQTAWAIANRMRFDDLTKIGGFSAAVRAYGNTHQLFDVDMRIMLLWSGIEGLLGVDGELTRRIALYAAILLDDSPDKKIQLFNSVKKAYGVRSKAVHGGNASQAVLEDGYRQASQILVRLLARCVEIGRVPTASELDNLAVAASVV